MAQDFYATFGFGAAETSIATVDADGAGLVATQGPHRLVQRGDAGAGVCGRNRLAFPMACRRHYLSATYKRMWPGPAALSLPNGENGTRCSAIPGRTATPLDVAVMGASLARIIHRL